MTHLCAADDLRDLQRGEHLVLFGFRLLALGHGDCPALRGTFCGLLSADADEAICGLLAFVRMVGWSGGRRIRLHTPGCCALSDDERQLLAVIAAAQGSLFDASEAGLKARLGAFLGAGPDEASLMAAQAVAATLACHGLHLPERANAPPTTSSPAAVGGATLH